MTPRELIYVFVMGKSTTPVTKGIFSWAAPRCGVSMSESTTTLVASHASAGHGHGILFTVHSPLVSTGPRYDDDERALQRASAARGAAMRLFYTLTMPVHSPRLQ